MDTQFNKHTEETNNDNKTRKQNECPSKLIPVKYKQISPVMIQGS